MCAILCCAHPNQEATITHVDEGDASAYDSVRACVLCAVLTPIRKKDHVVKNRVVENCVWFTVEVYPWRVKLTCCSFHHIPEKTSTIRHACTCTKPCHKISYARGFACEHMDARAVLLMSYPERSWLYVLRVVFFHTHRVC